MQIAEKVGQCLPRGKRYPFHSAMWLGFFGFQMPYESAGDVIKSLYCRHSLGRRRAIVDSRLRVMCWCCVISALRLLEMPDLSLSHIHLELTWPWLNDDPIVLKLMNTYLMRRGVDIEENGIRVCWDCNAFRVLCGSSGSRIGVSI